MFPTNTAGQSLYRRLGFREVGVCREQGKLDGVWVDVLIMEKLLEQKSISYGNIGSYVAAL